MQPYQSELTTALSAVDAAQSVIRQYYSGDIDVRTKPDNTPVTDADVHAEKTIRDILCRDFPEYGFYGEETGQSELDADYLWLVDPIDGTKSFVRHSPYFSTQIALMHQGRIVVGVSNAPAMEERAYAVRGQGAWVNQQPVQSSSVDALSSVYLSTGNIQSLATDTTLWCRYGKLVQRVARVRGYGDFYHYHQLARGQADVVIESDVNILDIAALSLLVTEAGGVFTDLGGNPVGLHTTSVLATATMPLHDAVLTSLAV